MSELVTAIKLLGLGVSAVATGAAFLKVLFQGPSEIASLRRRGYGVRPLLTGSLPKPDNGSNIDVIEGLEVVAHRGAIASVRQTRAISRELI